MSGYWRGRSVRITHRTPPPYTQRPPYWSMSVRTGPEGDHNLRCVEIQFPSYGPSGPDASLVIYVSWDNGDEARHGFFLPTQGMSVPDLPYPITQDMVDAWTFLRATLSRLVATGITFTEP